MLAYDKYHTTYLIQNDSFWQLLSKLNFKPILDSYLSVKN